MESEYRLYDYKIRRSRLKAAEKSGPIRIGNPHDVADLVRKRLQHQDREHFFSLHLDCRNQVVGIDLVAIGTAATVDVSPAELFRSALLSGAQAIAVAHNHPSGSSNPSEDDIHLTERLWSVGNLLGILLVDHVVVTDTDHYSFHQDNLVVSAEALKERRPQGA